jgi:hypothetical protein
MQLPTATTTRKCTLLRQRQQQSAVTAASSSNNRPLQAAVLPSIELSEVNCMRTCKTATMRIRCSIGIAARVALAAGCRVLLESTFQSLKAVCV